jgi:hypothetical protein
MPRDADFKQQRCADSDGFSLHATVRCGADDRQALEQLCRYITRPPCRPGDVPRSGVSRQPGQVEIHMLSAALPTSESAQYR